MLSPWLKTIALAATLLLVGCNSESPQTQNTPTQAGETSASAASNSPWQVRQAAVVGDGDAASATGQFLFGNGENFGASNWRFRIEAFHPAGIQNMYMVLGPSGGPYATHYLCANEDCGLNGGTSARGWVSGISPWDLEIAEGPGNYNADLYVIPVGGGSPVFVSGANFQWSPASLTISPSSSLTDTSLTLLWNSIPGSDVRYNISVWEIDGGEIAYRTGVQGNFSASGLNIPISGYSSVQVFVEAVNSSGVIARAVPLVVEQAVEQEPIELMVVLASTFVNANSPSIIGTVTRNDAEVTVSFNGGEALPADITFLGWWTLDTSNLNLDDGTYTVMVTATAGEDTAQTSGSVNIDRITPEISFDDAEYSFDLFDEVWTVSGTVSEEGYLYVSVRDAEENTTLVLALETASLEWSGNIKPLFQAYGLPIGEYTLEATAYDEAGNLSPIFSVPLVITDNQQGPPPVDVIPTAQGTQCLFMPAVLYADQANDLQWDVDPWNSLEESSLTLNSWPGGLGASLVDTNLSFSNVEPGLYSNLNFTAFNPNTGTQQIGPYSLEIKPAYNSGSLMTANPSTFSHELSRTDTLGRQWLIGDDPRFGTTNSRVVMVRLTEGGFPDSSFGTAGRMEINLRNFSSFPSDAEYPNNRIFPVTAEPIGTDWLIGGYVRHYDANTIVIGHSAFMLRVDHNGNPVTEFADNGLWFYEEPGAHLEVGALLVNGPEEIFVALNELDWESSQLIPKQMRMLTLNTKAETPNDTNLDVLFDLSTSLTMRVRVIAPVPGNSESMVLAGIRRDGFNAYISSTRITFNGNNWWFDGDYTPNMIENHITATNNPTLTHSLVTPDGYLWLTGKTNTVAFTQVSYIVATPLAGSAVGAAATDSLGFGVTHPLALMQGTDNDVMLILARSSSGTHAIAGKVFNNPLNVSSYIETGLTSGTGEFETDVRAAVAPGNRILAAYRLSNATTDRRVARYLPYALNNNMGLQNDCGIVALRESMEQDSPMYTMNLQDSINIDGDIVLIFGNTAASPSTVVNVLSDGERWDYRNSSLISDRLLGYQNGLDNLYALAFDSEADEFVALASAFGFFDDDDFGAGYINGVLRADAGTGELIPQFGLPSMASNMVLLPNAFGGFTPAVAWNDFNNGLQLKTPDSQLTLDENHDGDVHYMAVGTDGSLWLVLTDYAGGSTQNIKVQRYLPLTDPSTPLGLMFDYTLPLYDTNGFGDQPIGFALNDQNQALVYSTNYSDGDLAIRRILPGGGLDETFADGGVFSLPDGFTNPLEITSGRRSAGLVVDEQNNIFFPITYQEDFIIVKLLPNGELDTTFGEYGSVDLALALAFEFPGNFSGVRLGEFDQIQAIWEEGAGYTMVQLNPDGSLDTSFGRQGYVRMGPSADEMARQLATERNGRLYPLMHQQTFMNASVFWGLNADGSRIQDFGNPTPSTLRDGGSVSLAYSIPGGLQSSGRGDLFLGITYNGLEEYLAELFKYDLEMLGEGESNPQYLPFDPTEVPGTYETYTTAISPFINGRALIAGSYYADGEDGVFVNRIDPDGNLLSFPFGDESPASIAIADQEEEESDVVAVLDDGLGNVLLLLNTYNYDNENYRWVLKRLNSSNMTGEVIFERNDPLFNDAATDMAIDAQGRILVVEERELSVFDSLIQVTRLDTDGNVDELWDFDPMAVGYPQSINTLQVVGTAVFLGGLDDASKPLLVRLNESGNVTHRWHGSMLINSDYAEVVDLTLDPRGHLNVLFKAYKDSYWQTVITRLPAMY